MTTPDDFAFADEHGGSRARPAGASPQPQPQPPARSSRSGGGAAIAVPSLDEAHAADAARDARESDIFDPRALMRQHQQQQQQDQQQHQQQQQHPQQQQHHQQQQQQQQPAWPPPLLPYTPAPPSLHGTLPAPMPHYFEGGGGAAAAAAAAAGAAGAGGAAGAAPPPLPPSASSAAASAANAANANANAILVSRRQQGNPVLRHLRHVRWRWSDDAALGAGAPDFALGQSTGALFLSLRYHLLNPSYVAGRLRALQQRGAGGGGGRGGGRGEGGGPAAASGAAAGSGGAGAFSAAPSSSPYRLVVLLLLVDAEDPARPLAELSQLAIRADAALLCATSEPEAARYLEALQAFERKPAAGSLRPAGEPDYLGRVASALSAVRGVNRADALRLAEAFGSVAAMLRAGAGDLAAVRGMGPTKVRRLAEAFSQPFRRTLVARPVRGGGGGGGDAAAGAAAAAAAGGGAPAAPPSLVQQVQQQPQQPRPPQQQQQQSQQPPLPGLELPIGEEDDGAGEEGDDEDDEDDRLLQLADELGI